MIKDILKNFSKSIYLMFLVFFSVHSFSMQSLGVVVGTNSCEKAFKSPTEYLKNQYRKHNIPVPERHFVLGSGISAGLDVATKKFSNIWEEVFSLKFSDLEIQEPTAMTHKGLYRYFVHLETGKSICVQCGRLHGYEENMTARKTVRPVIEPFLAGTKKFTLTNIGGGLRSDLNIGTIIAMKDHVNATSQSPISGSGVTDHYGKKLHPQFPHMEEIYNKRTRDEIVANLRSAGAKVNEGTYICVPGPNLETPAEINLFAQWGLDIVGMSTVWEAIALKAVGAEVTGFSMVSNPGSGLKGSEITDENMHKLVKKNSKKMLQGFLCFCDKELKEK